MRKLSRAAFMNWLKSFGAKNIVGTTATANSCPIAKFLGNGYAMNTDRYGLENEWGDVQADTAKSAPQWARKFVKLIDAKFQIHGYPIPHKVTAKVSLEVLRKTL